MKLPWVEKYKPKSRKDLVGNEVAINGLYLFLKRWNLKNSKPGALLIGPAGCGKTSAVHAIANELGYQVTEVNASDTRKKASIKHLLGQASEFTSLRDQSQDRVILMDEVDGISGRHDRGGLTEFIKIIKKTRYPIICTANDPESDKLDKLKRYLRVYEYHRLDEFEIFELLLNIIEKEDQTVPESVVEQIAESSGGDIRAAINELESHLQGSKKVSLEKRDKMVTLTDVLNNLYRAKTATEAREALNSAPSNYFLLLLFIFDLTAKQCKTPEELAEAYEQIALADLTYRRIMRTQDWSQLKYFFDYLGPGIALARESNYFSKIKKLENIPDGFKIRGIAKRRLSKARKLAPTVAPQIHISENQFVFNEFDLFSKIILGQNGAEVAAALNLDDGQIEDLQKLDAKSNLIENIEEARQKVGKINLEQGSQNDERSKKFKIDDYLISTSEKKEKDDSLNGTIEKEEIKEQSDENQSTLDSFF